VSTIQALSSNETDLKQLKIQLNKDEAVLTKNMGILDDVLNNALDPAMHSLGYVFVLAAKLNNQKMDPQRFSAQVLRFLSTFTPGQIRLVPNKFAAVCRRFKEICIESNQAMRAVKPLRLAITKWRTGSECLTPVHADFLQACLSARCYNAALPILDADIYDINQDITSVTPRDMLLYYYYGGMIYTGLKDYKRAFNFFRTAVTSPAVVLSAIMVESYKKYILVSLLVHGKVVSLPRYTSSVVQRYHKTSFPQYQEFATAFGTQSTDDLHKCAEVNVEVFRKDKNLGLVKQCIQSLYSKNIQRHTQTYLTFSLQDMASSAKLRTAAEAEKHVLKMIEKGEIFATVNQKDGMVSFQEDPESYDTKKMTAHLDAQIQKVIDLGQKVRGIDENIASSAHYIQRTTVQERGRWGDFSDDFDGPGKMM